MCSSAVWKLNPMTTWKKVISNTHLLPCLFTSTTLFHLCRSQIMNSSLTLSRSSLTLWLILYFSLFWSLKRNIWKRTHKKREKEDGDKWVRSHCMVMMNTDEDQRRRRSVKELLNLKLTIMLIERCRYCDQPSGMEF